jgi:hypothetical protein
LDPLDPLFNGGATEQKAIGEGQVCLVNKVLRADGGLFPPKLKGVKW